MGDRTDGTWEKSERLGPWRRLRLRRADGRIYLDRWGIQWKRLGAVFLHRMEAPDPGVDLHDHPWWFASLVLWGGYTEERALVREAPMYAGLAERFAHATSHRGIVTERRTGSVKVMRLDECHRITHLTGRTSWSLVITGPVVRRWGFFLPSGWISEPEYDATVRTERRDLFVE